MESEAKEYAVLTNKDKKAEYSSNQQSEVQYKGDKQNSSMESQKANANQGLQVVQDNEGKYMIASSLATSNHCDVVILEDQVAAYDTCGGEECDTLLIEQSDLPEIQLHPEEYEVDNEERNLKLDSECLENDENLVENCNSLQTEETEKCNDERKSSRNEIQRVFPEREEGELSPEPSPLKDAHPETTKLQSKCLNVRKDSEKTVKPAAEGAEQISKAFEEFCKRLEEIQAEAKRQSLELKKSLTEKLKCESLPIEAKDKKNLLDAIQETFKVVVKDEEFEKRNRNQANKTKDKKQQDEVCKKSKDSETVRKQSKVAVSQTKPPRSMEKKTRESPLIREPDKRIIKDDKEICVDCINEGTNRQTRSRSRERSRRYSRDRSRRSPRIGERISREYRRSTSRSRGYANNYSGRGRSRSGGRSTDRKDRRSPLRSQDRHSPRRSISRRRRPSSPRRDREDNEKSGASKSASHVSRRDLYLKSVEKSKLPSSVDKGEENQRVRTLVKRQMKFISDVIDNPNPKASGGGQHKELDLDEKTIIIHGTEKVKRNQHSKNDFQAIQNLEDLDVMEKFLESLRNKNKENILKGEGTYSRLMKLRGQHQEKVTKQTGPYQSRISIRRPIDLSKDKALFFSSHSSKPVSKSRKDSGKKPEDATEKELQANKSKDKMNEENKNPAISKITEEPAKVSGSADQFECQANTKKDAEKDQQKDKSINDDGVKKRLSPSPLSSSPTSSSDDESVKAKYSTGRSKRVLEKGKEAKRKVASFSPSKTRVNKGTSLLDKNKKETRKNYRHSPSDSASSDEDLKPGKVIKGSSHKRKSPVIAVPSRKQRKIERTLIKRKHKMETMTESSEMSEESSGSEVHVGRKSLRRKKQHRKSHIPTKKVVKKKTAETSEESSSEYTESEDEKPRKQKVIIVKKDKLGRLRSLDPKYCKLLLPNKSKHSLIVKASKEKGGVTKIQRLLKPRRQIIQAEYRSSRRKSMAEKEDHTLEELETFLEKLREKRKETAEDEVHSELEMPPESLRKESLFLDRHRAKRKAKLMACVAVTAKASAKEAKFLEALKKAKSKHEIEKEMIMRKLKAGSDAIISASTQRYVERKLANSPNIAAKSGDRAPMKTRRLSRTSSKSDDDSIKEGSTYKSFDVSFPLKNTSLTDVANSVKSESNRSDVLTSEKAQALLNNLRAKKKAKKFSPEPEEVQG